MDFVRPWHITLVLLAAGALIAPAQEKQNDSKQAEKAPATEQPQATTAAAGSSSVPVSGSPEAHKLFNDTVKPTFVEVCLECHGGKKTRSGFDLTTREGLLKGGENGVAVVLQDAESSRLIKMLRHTEDPGMPYKKPPLDDAVISKISKWIALGALYDGSLKGAETTATPSKEHETLWSVQPLTNAPVPRIDSPWIRSPIDSPWTSCFPMIRMELPQPVLSWPVRGIWSATPSSRKGRWTRRSRARWIATTW